MTKDNKRLIAITLDDASIGRGTPDQEHERQVAIYDLIEENAFALANDDGGPYALHLGLMSNRLVLDIRREQGETVIVHVLSLTPLRKIVKDYFLICDSYYEALRGSSPSQIESVDMGRRGLHNEGAEQLRGRLEGKVEIDKETARRLFTLVCAVYRRG